MRYSSSRGQYPPVSAAEAIKMGLAPDGGLFVPEQIPVLTAADWEAMTSQNYQERAAHLLGLFLEEFTADEIRQCVQGAYNSTSFDDSRIAPTIELGGKIFILELWHGPTCAFKDMALQLLPRLMVSSAGKTGEKCEIVILVATSGDTGKAALEGFKDVPGVKIIVFYPQDGVSEVQKRQMISQSGSNVYVAAVRGNFDDAQNGVKQIFSDRFFIDSLAQHGMKMSSANSINWGRLLPQIVYYLSAYADLVGAKRLLAGDKVNIVVPTGNFGNILAAFYAGQMGMPINRLICASNANNVLTEFIRTGRYDRKRSFVKTISPSMDILISSNLERLLFELTGHDALKVRAWMEVLRDSGSYQVDMETARKLDQYFWADFSSDDETHMTIRKIWQEEGYLLDTHTAVGFDVYDKYLLATGDQTPTIIASTASPYKFGKSVAEAILPIELLAGQNEFSVLEVLSEFTNTPIPAAIKGLDQRPILHDTVTSKEGMQATVAKFLKL